MSGIKFEVGKTYCDPIVPYEVIKRTAKTVTICGTRKDDKPFTKRISIDRHGEEYIIFKWSNGVVRARMFASREYDENDDVKLNTPNGPFHIVGMGVH